MNDVVESEVTGDELPPIEIAANTMLGDLMGVIVEQVKALPKSWQELSERQQDDYLHRIECQTREAIKQAVHIIASENRVTISASVESVTFKEGVKAVLKVMPGAPGRHELADAEGRVVQVVIVHSEHMTSEAGKPKATKQQPELSLDDAPVSMVGDGESKAA